MAKLGLSKGRIFRSSQRVPLKVAPFLQFGLLISPHWRPSAVPKRVAFSTEFCKNRKQSSETNLKSGEVCGSEHLGPFCG